MTSDQTIPGLGGAAEEYAVELLSEAGYVLLEKNYRCPLGEVDIVAREGQTLCFVEVKMRSSAAQGHPLESITPAKRRKISLTAMNYLQEHQQYERVPVRFDVVAIIPNDEDFDADIVRNAFDSSV